ncbi:GGDEF domain-containing protein [Roseovarius sp. A21]|uniref:GGDEF domain-containing protein n=1 Tax=Roseovarius bejariae TaxID=2576383 RepID=A0A844CV71_9RHOB|nr:GGDEF domain-containing protein [Roseovarius bejariae]MRU14580.1 GGDEF domain-containing protein [Roseovarius bejariae]
MKDEQNETALYALLDVLCPMHAVLNATGHVVHVGPTFAKLAAETPPEGRRFLELLELKRPKLGDSMEALRRAEGAKLHFQLRTGPQSDLKGTLVCLPEQGGFGPAGGAVVNLSFGISVMEAVRDFTLTSADFAATDLAIEMLYLIEAKSAAMEASRKLNLRLQGAKIAAEEQAFTDTLTGLKNRRAMQPVLERLMETEHDFVLMALDLDYFKSVNDTLGHAAGDHVLQRVARRIVSETRGEDTIIRTGGDEFVLIFDGLTNRDRVAEIAGRLIARLERPIPFGEKECRVSASIGASLSCEYARVDPEQMMQDADVALYAAKDRGRGRYVVYDPTLRHTQGIGPRAPSES